MLCYPVINLKRPDQLADSSGFVSEYALSTSGGRRFYSRRCHWNFSL